MNFSLFFFFFFCFSPFGQLMSFAESVDMAREFRKPAVKPTTVFRGCLEIGEQLKIGVWAYKRETKVKSITFKKRSTRVELVRATPPPPRRKKKQKKQKKKKTHRNKYYAKIE